MGTVIRMCDFGKRRNHGAQGFGICLLMRYDTLDVCNASGPAGFYENGVGRPQHGFAIGVDGYLPRENDWTMAEEFPPTGAEQAPIPDYHKTEIKEIYQRIREIAVLRVQVATFFGTANLTLLGLAFSTRQAGLMLLAAGLLILWWITDAFSIRELKPFYYRGLELERFYSPDWQDSLLRTYLDVSKAKSDWVESLSRIAQLDSRDEQIRQLRRIRPAVEGLYRAVAVLLVTEIVGALILSQRTGWSLF